MTKYDPFSFGQVKLGDKAPSAGGPAPDDMLFADAGPVKQAPPAAADSWALLDESVDSLLPGATAPAADAIEFGADILGEVGPEPVRAAPPPAPKVGKAQKATPQPAKPAAAAAPRSKPAVPPSSPAGKAAPVARVAGGSIQATESAARAAAAQAPTQPVRRGAPMMPMRRSAGIAAVLVPLAVLAVGGTAASWFYLMQNNPVMAGIAALSSLVGAAFTRLSLRG
ncbi:MAG: hypothetical protein JNK15_18895 [Planctomycetes bacterium]|nr:hypothetical protein [Planctomycetota bacterium]